VLRESPSAIMPGKLVIRRKDRHSSRLAKKGRKGKGVNRVLLAVRGKKTRRGRWWIVKWKGMARRGGSSIGEGRKKK